MEEFLARRFYNNTVEEWLISLAIIGITMISAKILLLFSTRVLKKITEKSKTRIDDILIDMFEEPLVFGLTIFGIWLGMEQLEFSHAVTVFENKIYHILITLNVTWLVARTLNALIDEYIQPIVEKSESDLDDQMLPVLRKTIRFVIWTLGIIVALNNAGYDVGALIAGLGIGGIAFAMAAKDTVANLFGGITILTDKPFKIGDRIIIGGYEGHITDIGIRSTRLRTLAGRIVTIPNLKFTDSFIENVSSEPSRKIILFLGLTYSTSPDKMRKAIELLKEIVQDVPAVEKDNATYSFKHYKDSALEIEFVYYIKSGENILNTQTEVNLQILSKFNQEELNFAYPTRTVYQIQQN